MRAKNFLGKLIAKLTHTYNHTSFSLVRPMNKASVHSAWNKQSTGLIGQHWDDGFAVYESTSIDRN